MNMASKTEHRPKIQVKLFITEMCPQCAIAITRIEEIAKDIEEINLDIINFSKLNNSNNNIKKLAVTPYYVIDEKFVVPGPGRSRAEGAPGCRGRAAHRSARASHRSERRGSEPARGPGRSRPQAAPGRRAGCGKRTYGSPRGWQAPDSRNNRLIASQGVCTLIATIE